jgi:hypothetical protein
MKYYVIANIIAKAMNAATPNREESCSGMKSAI